MEEDEAGDFLVKTGEKQAKNKDVTGGPKEALRIRVEELKIQNAALFAEKDMYEQFFSRLDPHDLATAENPRTKSGGHRWRQESQAEHQLTLQQKCYVALSEIAEIQQEREKIRRRYERNHDCGRDSIEEAELRQEDIRKAKNEFEYRLLKPLRENRLDLHAPEKVLQYIKDKSKINQIERCNLKTQSMLANEKRLLQLLQQRKDLGKADYEDFFQDFKDQHGEINLHEVHVNNIKTQQPLNSHKEKLHRVTSEMSNLSKGIKEKQQKLARLEEAIHCAEEECVKAQILNQHLKQQIADYEAPDTKQYMLIKEKHRKLQQSILTWERKVGVAEVNLSTDLSTLFFSFSVATKPYVGVISDGLENLQ
uniref:Cilia- and flagella-associated protein 263 n=1 Tax=Neogobius melanostomus TaxID=47308 RepID=A0A8C6T7N5_9GOBI